MPVTDNDPLDDDSAELFPASRGGRGDRVREGQDAGAVRDLVLPCQKAIER
jgi:hypothetical protein